MLLLKKGVFDIQSRYPFSSEISWVGFCDEWVYIPVMMGGVI